MNCTKCGSLLNDTDQFCTNCGAPREVAPTPVTPVVPTPVTPVAPVAPAAPVAPTMAPAAPVTPVAPAPTNPVNDFMNSTPATPVAPVAPVAPAKGGSKGLLITLIVVVIVAAVAIIAVLLSGNKNNSGNSNEGNNSNGGQVATVQTYNVNYNGYTLKVPNEYVYEKENDAILIGNAEDTWAIELQIAKGRYETIKARKDMLKGRLNANNDATVKTLGGVEFVTLEVTTAGRNFIAAYAKVSEDSFVGIAALNIDNEYDYSLLEKVAPIVKSITLANVSNNAVVKPNISVTDIQDVLNEE